MAGFWAHSLATLVDIATNVAGITKQLNEVKYRRIVAKSWGTCLLWFDMEATVGKRHSRKTERQNG